MAFNFRLPWRKKQSPVSHQKLDEKYDWMGRLDRSKYVLNISRLILPPFSFERVFGVKLFDDQRLTKGLATAFSNFINSGQEAPNYTTVYDELRRIYQEARTIFLADFHRDQNTVFAEKCLFFNTDRPDQSLQLAESKIRMWIAREIERCETFEQYLRFREQLYNEQIFPFIATPYVQLKDTHDYTETPKGVDEEHVLLTRGKYIFNICRFILPPFSLTPFFHVRVFDDQSLSGGITMAFADFINFGIGKPPSYADINDEFRRVYKETRAIFLADFNRDPNTVFDEKKLFFHPARPEPSLQFEDYETRMRIAREIKRCVTFEQYIKFRERLYNEKVFPFTEVPYSQVRDTHDYTEEVSESPREIPPR